MGFKGPQMYPNVDVFSDFDQNEAHVLIRYHKYIIIIIYTTKIDGVVCPPNISETVAGRLMKLAHRPPIASTMINSFQNQFYCPFY